MVAAECQSVLSTIPSDIVGQLLGLASGHLIASGCCALKPSYRESGRTIAPSRIRNGYADLFYQKVGIRRGTKQNAIGRNAQAQLVHDRRRDYKIMGGRNVVILFRLLGTAGENRSRGGRENIFEFVGHAREKCLFGINDLIEPRISLITGD
jgi:hypothetical protein